MRFVLFFVILGVVLCQAKAQTMGEQLAAYAEGEGNAPGKDCYGAVYDRVNAVLAARQAGALPALAGDSFSFIWRTNYDLPGWSNISNRYRPYKAFGPPGALTGLGKTAIVSHDDIWDGKLNPGAVLQLWWDKSDTGSKAAGERVFRALRDGDASIAGSFNGHACIFLRYTRNLLGQITGVRVADQGFLNGRDIAKGELGFWIGANW